MMKLKKISDHQNRCAWVTNDPVYIAYHDNEWGIPIYDDQRLFEFLILEGAQAGLSWITILKKRDYYRACFDNFNPNKIANYKQDKIDLLLNNPNIIRNRLKIVSAVINARAYLNIVEEWSSFSDYIWHFVNRKPIQNHWPSFKEVPCQTLLSDTMSKDLKKRGFKFVGSKICYAYMEAVGMVNDHTSDCFCYQKNNPKAFVQKN